MADRFALSYPDLQVRFGLMSHQEVASYFEFVNVALATVETRRVRPRKLSEMTPRLTTTSPPEEYSCRARFGMHSLFGTILNHATWSARTAASDRQPARELHRY